MTRSEDFKPLHVKHIAGQAPYYAVASAAAATVDLPPRSEAMNAAIVSMEWIESKLPAERVGLICGDGGHPRDIARKLADQIYRHGRASGIIPVWLFGGWWWLRIILALVNHWLANRGSWE